jgi:hypothetical protein
MNSCTETPVGSAVVINLPETSVLSWFRRHGAIRISKVAHVPNVDSRICRSLNYPNWNIGVTGGNNDDEADDFSTSRSNQQ